MEKPWFYEIIVMVKDKKRYAIKDAMSIKISFMHYRNYITWTKVKSPLVFEEFDLVCPFMAFFFSLSLSIYKNVNLSKYPVGAEAAAPPAPPDFCGPATN